MKKLLPLIEELRKEQEKKLYQLGKEIVPTLSLDDLLQPNDFNELEQNPHFRYEEGILHGILSVAMAMRASGEV